MAAEDAFRRHSPPRADAGAVVAVGRRQVDDRAQPAGKRSRPRTVGQRDHAAAPRQRDRGRALPLLSHARVRAAARFRRAAGMGRGARQLLRHAARAGRGGDGARAATCCSTSTGRAPSSSRRRCAADIVSIFILPPSMTELKARLKRRAEDQEAVIETRLAERPHRDRALARVRLRRRQRRPRPRLRRRCSAIVTAERLRRDRRPGLFDFVSGLLDEKT